MEIRLETIEMDASIQCRAAIDTATVGEYAERMQVELEKFPAVVLFGTAGRSWIGDGWHRVFAARQIGLVGIKADLRAGGRKEALQHALGANAANGLRRSPADKQRAIEVCVKEFPELTQAKIAEMVGCSREWVNKVKGECVNCSHIETTVTRSNGKSYPSSIRKPSTIAPDAPEADPLHDNSGDEDTDAPDATTGGKEGDHKMNTPKRPVGMEYAMTAIDALKRIPLSDPMRSAGFAELHKLPLAAASVILVGQNAPGNTTTSIKNGTFKITNWLFATHVARVFSALREAARECATAQTLWAISAICTIPDIDLDRLIKHIKRRSDMLRRYNNRDACLDMFEAIYNDSMHSKNKRPIAFEANKVLSERRHFGKPIPKK